MASKGTQPRGLNQGDSAKETQRLNTWIELRFFFFNLQMKPETRFISSPKFLVIGYGDGLELKPLLLPVQPHCIHTVSNSDFVPYVVHFIC